jgi:hypothetical protein
MQYTDFHADIATLARFYVQYMGKDILASELTKFSWGDIPEATGLKAALASDASGLTFFGEIMPLIRDFGGLKRYTLEDVAKPSADVKVLIDDYNATLQVLNESVIGRDYLSMIGDLSKTIWTLQGKHSNEDTIQEWLKGELFMLNQGLDKYIDSFTVHTLSKGAVSSAPSKILDRILTADGRDNFLRLAHQSPNGISIVLVRDRDDIALSFFTLILRQGDNIILISDEDKTPYPGRYKDRRNDRTQSGRIGASPFPYELLDLEIADKGRNITPSSTQLTKGKCDEPTFGTLSTLSSGDIQTERLTTLLLCTQRLQQRWLQNLDEATLLFDESALRLPSQSGSTLPALRQPGRKRINVDNVSMRTLTKSIFDESEKSAGIALSQNIVMERVEKRLLPLINDVDLLPTGASVNFPIPIKIKANHHDREVAHVTFAPLALLQGSKERVKADALFCARENQAQALAAHMVHEYERNAPERLRFIQQKVMDSQRIKRMIARLDGGFFTATHDDHAFLDAHPELQGFRNKHRILECKRETRFYISNNGKVPSKIYDDFSVGFSRTLCLVDRDPETNIYTCPFSDEKASVFIMFRPIDGFGLAQLLGEKRESLPFDLDVAGIEPYMGNSILRRVDPVMNLKHPITLHPISLLLAISWSTWTKWRKELEFKNMSRHALKALLDERYTEKD